ncbi:MAG: hypothetical protein ACYCOR_21855 [Acidobacteriaceae bacterium]
MLRDFAKRGGGSGMPSISGGFGSGFSWRQVSTSPTTKLESRVSGVSSRALSLMLNALATVQFVWCYLTWDHSPLVSVQYENGLAPTPFQYRLLMMLPLRWAHSSPVMNAISGHLTNLRWFDFGVRPEGLLQALVDILSIVCTGLIARSLYQAASSRRLLTPWVYPLTLAMVFVTYSSSFTNRVRYVYDLPSMAFFALGLYLLYFRRSVYLFAALFLVATINRETSLFLLVFFVLAKWIQENRSLPRMLRPSVLLPLALLSIFWLAWHHWVVAHFAHNSSVGGIRWKDNIYLLLAPFSWPQLLAVGAFTVPLLLFYRRLLQDALLTVWLWSIAVWFVFMMIFGVIIEIRIFGELIPYLACCTALIAEQVLLRRFESVNLEVRNRAFTNHEVTSSYVTESSETWGTHSWL